MKSLLPKIRSFLQRLRGRQNTTLVNPLDPAVIAEAFSHMGIPRVSAEEAMESYRSLFCSHEGTLQNPPPLSYSDFVSLMNHPLRPARVRDYLGNVVPDPHAPLSTPSRPNTPPKVVLIDTAENTRHEIPRVTGFTVRQEGDHLSLDLRLEVDRLERYTYGDPEVLTAVLGPSTRLVCHFSPVDISWRTDCLYYSPAKELHCAVNPVGCKGCREFTTKGSPPPQASCSISGDPPQGVCPVCYHPADGLDGEHCQTHWENACAEAWWEVVGTAEQAQDGSLDG